jgi:AcrR family transcriptional regulator
MIKQRIIEEASKLFAKSGVKNVTMGDLAKHLGISKRTIYENFKDKEELLVACADASHVESEEFSRKVLSRTDNMVEAMLAMLQIEGGASLIEEIRKYYPQVYKEHVLRIIDDRSNCYKQMINRGMAEGVFRENLNLEIIVYFFNGRAKDFLLFDLHLNKFSMNEIFENVAVTFLRGMCTDKGLEIIDNYKSS